MVLRSLFGRRRFSFFDADALPVGGRQKLVTTDQGRSSESLALTLINVQTDRSDNQRMLRHAVDDQAVFSPEGSHVAFRRSQGDSSDEILLVDSWGRTGSDFNRKATTQGDVDD